MNTAQRLYFQPKLVCGASTWNSFLIPEGYEGCSENRLATPTARLSQFSTRASRPWRNRYPQRVCDIFHKAKMHNNYNFVKVICERQVTAPKYGNEDCTSGLRLYVRSGTEENSWL